MSGPKRYVTRVRGAKDSVPVDIEDLGDGKYLLALGGRRHTVDARVLEHGAVSLIVDGRSYDVEMDESGDEVQVLVSSEVLTVDVADERAVSLRAGWSSNISPISSLGAITLQKQPGASRSCCARPVSPAI